MKLQGAPLRGLVFLKFVWYLGIGICDLETKLSAENFLV